MTVTLHLPPEVEQAYLAEARAKGVPVDVVNRDTLVARQANRPAGEVNFEVSNSTAAAFVAAMQASPYKEISFEPAR